MRKQNQKAQLGLPVFYVTLIFVFLVSSSYGATYYYKTENGVPSFTNVAPNESGYKRLTLYSGQKTPSFFPQKSTGGFSYSKKHDEDIVKTSKRYGVDPNLVRAIIKVESNFNSNAVSPKGAMGVMQLMPDTAKNQGVSEPFDPSQNIKGGVKYLKKLMKMFNGNMHLALAGYNAGENAVVKYGYSVPPYTETQNYVEKVLTHYNYLKNKPVKDNRNDKKVIETKVVKTEVVKAKTASEVKIKTAKQKTEPSRTEVVPVVDNAGRFTVQIASFSEVGLAEEMEEKMKSKGYRVFTQKTDLPGKGTWYRVRVGRFSSKEEAKQFGSTIRNVEPRIKSVFITYL